VSELAEVMEQRAPVLVEGVNELQLRF